MDIEEIVDGTVETATELEAPPDEGEQPTRVEPADLDSLKQEFKELKEAFRGEVESLAGEVRTLKPEKDPLDVVLESLSKVDPDSDEGRLRADIEALAPAIKKLQKSGVLVPEVGQHRLVLRGALQLIDKLAFTVDQLVDELGDKKPLGLKYMDRIEKARQDKMAKAGGKGRPPAYHDTFAEIQHQLRQEEARTPTRPRQGRRESIVSRIDKALERGEDFRMA
jgi:hypothetical protein